MNRNKPKIAWTLALIGLGWAFFLLPSAEDLPDARPATATDWRVWLAINVIALILVHRWISEPARIARREWREQNRRQWIEDRRAKINARDNHPTGRK